MNLGELHLGMGGLVKIADLLLTAPVVLAPPMQIAFQIAGLAPIAPVLYIHSSAFFASVFPEFYVVSAPTPHSLGGSALVVPETVVNALIFHRRFLYWVTSLCT